MTNTPEVPESLRPFFLALDEHQQRAALLLVLLNRGADAEFKSRYRRRWWTILEERARLAARTSSDLVRWSSSISSRLGGQVGRNAADRELWAQLIRSGDDARVLDCLDQDAPALIAYVRANSDVARQIAEAVAAADRGEDLTPEQEALL